MQWLCANPVMVFIQLRFIRQQFCFETTIVDVNKHKLLVAVFTTIHWVKPAWLDEPPTTIYC